MGKTIARYRKYAYWTRRQDALRLKEVLAAKGRTVIEPRKSVCLPLSKRADIGIVPPEKWKNATLCKRPLTWYWISPLAGKYLNVSSDDWPRSAASDRSCSGRSDSSPRGCPMRVKSSS